MADAPAPPHAASPGGANPDGGPSRGVRVGRVGGVPVVLMPSWFVIALIMLVLYAPAYGLVSAVGAALVLLLSVFLHEVAHALAARAVGTRPERIVLDLWGGHTAFAGDLATPGRSAFVSLVGPGTNAVIGVAGWLLLPTTWEGTAGFLRLAVIVVNLGLAIFNVLPGLPLDGGRALEALVWKVTGDRWKGTVAAGWVGRLVAVALVVRGLAPLLQGGRFSVTTVVWTLAIAWLLWQGASSALAVGRFRQRTPGLRATDLLRPAIGVAPGTALSAVVGVLAQGTDVVVVAGPHRAVGVLDPAAVARVPASHLAATPVEAVSRTLAAGASLPAGLAGAALIGALQAEEHPEYAVFAADGTLAGRLLTADVVTALTGGGR